MNLASQLESLLFVVSKPLSIRKLAEILQKDREDVKVGLAELKKKLEEGDRGLILIQNGEQVELASHPSHSGIIQTWLKQEQTGEMTKPALETLTIIAYRGPVAKGELETIRGVNCSFILRNLLIRGLIEEEQDRGDHAPRYRVSMDFMHFLGISRLEELPDYVRLNRDQNLEDLLKTEIA